MPGQKFVLRRECGLGGPHGASRPGAIEHWKLDQWTMRRLWSTALLSNVPRRIAPSRPPAPEIGRATTGARRKAVGRPFGITNGKFQMANLRSAICNSERSEDWESREAKGVPKPLTRSSIARGRQTRSPRSIMAEVLTVNLSSCV